jgi:hypothetical protein
MQVIFQNDQWNLMICIGPNNANAQVNAPNNQVQAVPAPSQGGPPDALARAPNAPFQEGSQINLDNISR